MGGGRRKDGKQDSQGGRNRAGEIANNFATLCNIFNRKSTKGRKPQRTEGAGTGNWEYKVMEEGRSDPLSPPH